MGTSQKIMAYDTQASVTRNARDVLRIVDNPSFRILKVVFFVPSNVQPISTAFVDASRL